MSKYAYAILGLCIASVFFLNYLTRNSDQITPEENQPVDQSVDYTTGTHQGYVMSAKEENGRVYLSIDFLQSFTIHKGAFMAALEDDYCNVEKIKTHIDTTYPSDTPVKIVQELRNLSTKEDVLIYFGKVLERDIDAVSNYTGCFPNGIRYFRNKSKVVRERTISPMLKTSIDGVLVTYETVAKYFKEMDIQAENPPVYSITMENGVVLNIENAPAW